MNKLFKFKFLIDKILPKNKFLKATSILVSGSAGSQLITLLAAPVLTRLYTVNDFGLFGVFSSIVAILGVVIVLKYELALPLQSNNSKTLHLAVSCFIIAILMIAIFSIPIFFLDEYFLIFNKYNFLIDFRWIIIFSVALVGIYKILQYLALKRKIYQKITRASLLQSFTSAFIQITSHNYGFSGLIFGILLGQFLGILSLINNLNRKFFVIKIQKKKLFQILLKNKNFPLFTSWGALAQVGVQQLPNILYAILFNPSVAGIIFLIQKVIKAPIVLFGRAISDVVLIQGQEAYKNKKLLNFIEDVYSKLLKSSIAIIIFISLISENIFGFIFGENWSKAGKFLIFLIPFIIFQFSSLSLHSVFQILNKQKEGSLFQLLLLIFIIIGIFIGYLEQNIYLSIFLYSFLGSIVFILMTLYLWKEIGGSIIKYIKIILKEIFIGIMLNIPIITYKFVNFINNSNYLLSTYSFLTILLILSYFYRNINQFR